MDSNLLIVGGGLSGLTIAYRLQEAGVPFILIEARDRLGGRINTYQTKSGGTVEMGATWFADKHRHLMDFIQELDLPYEPQFYGSKAIYDYQSSKRTIEKIAIPYQQEATYYFSDGSVDLIKALYSKIDASRICLGERLTSLTLSENGWDVITSRRQMSVPLVINTLPPNLFAQTVTVQPQLPLPLMELCEGTHTWMGESIKVGAELSVDGWRGQSLGSFFSQFGPATELYDHQHQQRKVPILMGFIDPHFGAFSSEERKERFVQQLLYYLPDTAWELLEYHDLDWKKEEFTYASYGTDLVPHQNNGAAPLRAPIFEGRLLFAGSETARSFPGYMDGAVERGLEVADQVIRHYLHDNQVK